VIYKVLVMGAVTDHDVCWRIAGSKVHDGFQETQGRTADAVLSTVKSALASTGFKRVLTTGVFRSSLVLLSGIADCCPTGHSLGAAIATLDAMMLRMQLGSDVQVDSVVFGLPRVGNQAFADMVDSMVRCLYGHVGSAFDINTSLDSV
jgi:hypothetical protein